MNNDLISRDYVEKIIISEVVDLQDGTEEWRTYVNDTCENILNKVHSAPAVGIDKELERQREELYEESKKLFMLAKILGKDERPQGEWITNQEYIDKEFNGHYEGSCFNSPYNCSCCGYSPEDNRPKFCPNCGAQMMR